MSALDELKKRRDDEDGLSPLEYVILRDAGEWCSREESHQAAAELAQLRARNRELEEYFGWEQGHPIPEGEPTEEEIALRAELDAKTKAVDEIVKSVYVLKRMLSADGEYSICRTDHKTMELGEVLTVGDVLERINNAMNTSHPEGKEE